MTYHELGSIAGADRIGRYLNAVNNNQDQAVLLYALNIKLSGSFFDMHALFEIALRNRINSHYQAHFNDPDWLINQCNANGIFLKDHQKSLSNSRMPGRKQVTSLTNVNEVKARLQKENKSVTNSRIVAWLSFSFWCRMFDKSLYNLGGKGLMRVFGQSNTAIKKPGQKTVYKELGQINGWRNRIAHFEPLVFGSNTTIDTTNARESHRIYCFYMKMMGFSADSDNSIFNDIDFVLNICNEIDNI